MRNLERCTSKCEQVEATDSWEKELPQDASITLILSGTFVDVGMVDGQADTEDLMKYAFSVQNIGSVTLSEIGEDYDIMNKDLRITRDDGVRADHCDHTTPVVQLSACCSIRC